MSSSGGGSGRSGRGSVDAGGEERLLEPAGFEHLGCLGVYPGGGRRPAGGDGIPGLLRCPPGAAELSVSGAMRSCAVSAQRNRWRCSWSFKDV